MYKHIKLVAIAGAVALSFLGGQAQADSAINGAGATFPYPIYGKWAEAYKAKTGIGMNYQSIGSGGGIKQIKAKTVDFGASDAPLEPGDLDESGLLQFPMIIGGVVPVVNMPGMAPGSLKLDGQVLADIYLGKVKKWNAPAIAKLNKGVKLPDTAISVVHRADGSGTTWIFTNYLSKVSGEWKTKVGNDKSVSWPVGIGGKGNEGVASYVTRIKGSIGYVEYAYALQNKMNHVKLQNQAGKFVDPESNSFQAAAANADWSHAPGYYMVLTDQPGAESWPITGASFILMHKSQQDAKIGAAVLNFFDWAYHNGQQMAEKLDYVPMPDNVVKLVEKSWASTVKGPDGSPVWTSAQ
jgi:phosphate transport system substrate-binding protein